jgi:hypothetical protein
MPDVNVDYTAPTPLPPVTKCTLVSATTDFTAGTVSGLCVQQDASGAVNGPAIPFQLPLSVVDLTSLATTLVTALQAAGILPPGTVVVTP